MNIEDLLQAMTSAISVERMGGASKTDARSAESGLLDLLGGLLGGGRSTSGTDATDLLRDLLGGGSGGGGSALGIAEETGLSPALIQSALALVVGKLLRGRAQDAEATSGAAFEAGAGATSVNLDSLLERMRGGADVDAQTLNATGLPQELAAKAGIDLPQAIKALQAILALLTGSKAKTTKRRSTKSTSSTAKSRNTKSASATAKSRSTKSTPSSKSKSTAKKASSGAARKTTTKKTDDEDKKPATRTRRSTTGSTGAESTVKKPSTTSRARKPAASTEEKPAAKKPSTTSRTRKPVSSATKPRKKPATGSGGTSSGDLDNILDGWSVSG